LTLTLAAARQVGVSFAPRLSGDRLRIAAAAGVVVLSLPWVALLPVRLFAEPWA
jgi:hypothetical protein